MSTPFVPLPPPPPGPTCHLHGHFQVSHQFDAHIKPLSNRSTEKRNTNQFPPSLTACPFCPSDLHECVSSHLIGSSTATHKFKRPTTGDLSRITKPGATTDFRQHRWHEILVSESTKCRCWGQFSLRKPPSLLSDEEDYTRYQKPPRR
jgi:hypothetical protein